MDWQTAGVVTVVAGAVYFLAQRMLITRRRRKQPAQTFVPLSSIKKRSDNGCH
jgi:hypothetical protein